MSQPPVKQPNVLTTESTTPANVEDYDSSQEQAGNSSDNEEEDIDIEEELKVGDVVLWSSDKTKTTKQPTILNGVKLLKQNNLENLNAGNSSARNKKTIFVSDINNGSKFHSDLRDLYRIKKMHISKKMQNKSVFAMLPFENEFHIRYYKAKFIKSKGSKNLEIKHKKDIYTLPRSIQHSGEQFDTVIDISPAFDSHSHISFNLKPVPSVGANKSNHYLLSHIFDLQVGEKLSMQVNTTKCEGIVFSKNLYKHPKSIYAHGIIENPVAKGDITVTFIEETSNDPTPKMLKFYEIPDRGVYGPGMLRRSIEGADEDIKDRKKLKKLNGMPVVSPHEIIAMSSQKNVRT